MSFGVGKSGKPKIKKKESRYLRLSFLSKGREKKLSSALADTTQKKGERRARSVCLLRDKEERKRLQSLLASSPLMRRRRKRKDGTI